MPLTEAGSRVQLRGQGKTKIEPALVLGASRKSQRCGPRRSFTNQGGRQEVGAKLSVWWATFSMLFSSLFPL